MSPPRAGFFVSGAWFSRPMTALWDYRHTESEPIILRSHGSRPYRFFSADREVGFLHEMIKAAVEEETPRELAWLQSYDEAFETLDRELDLPQNELAHLIRMAHSNGGVLSRHRRKQFSHPPDAVLARIEAASGRHSIGRTPAAASRFRALMRLAVGVNDSRWG